MNLAVVAPHHGLRKFRMPSQDMEARNSGCANLQNLMETLVSNTLVATLSLAVMELRNVRVFQEPDH